MPIHRSGMFSLFTFHWITNFMWRTFRKGYLDEESMWTCPTEESAVVNGQRLDYCYSLFEYLDNFLSEHLDMNSLLE